MFSKGVKEEKNKAAWMVGKEWKTGLPMETELEDGRTKERTFAIFLLCCVRRNWKSFPCSERGIALWSILISFFFVIGGKI